MRNGKKRYNELTPLQAKVLKLDLEGLSLKEIAAIMGVSCSRISNIRAMDKYRKTIDPNAAPRVKHENAGALIAAKHEEIVREEIHRQLDPVIKLIKTASLPAAKKIIERMESSRSQGVELEAAKEILDRAGYAPEKKVVTRTIELSSDDAERMMEAMKYTEIRTRVNGG